MTLFCRTNTKYKCQILNTNAVLKLLVSRLQGGEKVKKSIDWEGGRAAEPMDFL